MTGIVELLGGAVRLLTSVVDFVSGRRRSSSRGRAVADAYRLQANDLGYWLRTAHGAVEEAVRLHETEPVVVDPLDQATELSGHGVAKHVAARALHELEHGIDAFRINFGRSAERPAREAAEARAALADAIELLGDNPDERSIRAARAALTEAARHRDQFVAAASRSAPRR